MGLQLPALKTMMIIWILLLGNTPTVSPVVTLAGVAAAAGQAITVGASVVTTSIYASSQSGYRVTCTIFVENWTRFPLMYASANLGDGRLTTPPTEILPAEKEAFTMRKRHSSVYGVWGTASWTLQELDRLVVVMFSAPYNFNHHSNWMGLGMTREGLTPLGQGNRWFNHMYNGKSDSNFSFVRDEYYYDTDPIIYRNERFEMSGSMTDTHHAVINFVFRPALNNTEDLAGPIRELLGLNQTSSR